MKRKHLLPISLVLFTVFIFVYTVRADIFDDIALAIKSGNYKEVAKYFSSRVELSIDETEDIYSKTQAEMILRDFFEKNPPVSFVIKHKGSSAKGLPYVIGYLQTTSGKYRTYLLFKEFEGKLYLQEMQFEKE